MTGMTQEREAKILEGAIAKFGNKAQAVVAIEECSELQKALTKWLRLYEAAAPGAPAEADEAAAIKAIHEEMADNSIMLNQLALIFGDANEEETAKMERLAGLIGMEETFIPAYGEHFMAAGIEFICLGVDEDKLHALAAAPVFDAEFDESNRNNWNGSSLQERLADWAKETFPEDSMLPIVSDLTADDGMTDYGTSEDIAALITCDLYRKHRSIIPQLDEWWWTMTPWSCLPSNCYIVRNVLTSGALSRSGASNSYGVVPRLLFNLKSDALRISRCASGGNADEEDGDE
mgnify:CR=1 FL=1